jgi:transposase
MEKGNKKQSVTQIVKEIKRRTRRTFSSDEKIKIVLEGMRGEDTISAICRKHGIHVNNYFKWSKEFIEAGKRRLSGDTLREATRDGVTDLRRMNDLLKRELAFINEPITTGTSVTLMMDTTVCQLPQADGRHGIKYLLSSRIL